MSVPCVYFALQTISIGCHISLSQWWHTVCQISDTQLLYVCVCIVCPGGADFGTCIVCPGGADFGTRHLISNMKVNTDKRFFSDNYNVDIFMFISAIISLLATTLTVYLLCKHKKLRALITSLVLHQVKEVGTETQQTNSKRRTLAYIGIILTVLSLILVTFLHYRISKFCKGHRFSNWVKIMIFISDVQNYILVKVCKTAVSIHLFKISGMLKAKNIKLNRNYLWDTLEIDWKEVSVTFNGNKITKSSHK